MVSRFLHFFHGLAHPNGLGLSALAFPPDNRVLECAVHGRCHYISRHLVRRSKAGSH